MWDGALDPAFVKDSSWHNSAKLRVAESDFNVGAITVWTHKVSSIDNSLSVAWILDWTILWNDLSDYGSVIVEITEGLFGRDDFLPVLLVEREVEDSLGALRGIWSVPNDNVVIHVGNFRCISNIIAIKVFELHVHWNVVSIWALLSSDLLEANTGYFDPCSTRRRTGLWSQGVDKNGLIVREGVLDVTLV